MGWSTDFKAALAEASYTPRYLLEWVKVPSGPLRVFGGNLRLSSFYDSLGYQPLITKAGSSFSGARLTPRDWICQPGEFDLGFDAEANPDIRRFAQRGQAVVLKVGLQRQGAWVYEPVLFATIAAIRYSSRGWVLRCRGIEGALNSRLTTTAGESLLCHDLASTDLDANYTAGDATVTVVSTAGFRGDGVSVGATGGVIKLTPSGSEAFYLTYTGTTATTFTGCSATAKFGTTAANVTAGPAGNVTEVAYTKGHPCEVVRRVLCSTGDGSNGPEDILPASWGYGLDDSLVDARDMLDHIAYTQPSTGADDWHWVVDAEVDDGQARLNGWLNGAGYFLTQYQGQITCRAAIEPWAQGVSGAHSIVESDIAEIVSYSQWGADAANLVEYQRTRVITADGTDSETSAMGEVDHHPARGTMEHVAGGLYADSTNLAEILAELVSRLKQWDMRTPEYLVVRTHGWRHAKMAPGDECDLTTRMLLSRDGAAFVGRQCLVLSATPDWFGSDTTIELAILPTDETVPWRATP